jgi:hypothetical protein
LAALLAGTCLCGGVAFESDGPVLDFVFDHCSRCRKATGSAFLAEILVPAASFRWVRGERSVRTYEAPIRERPPPYRRAFCATCGGIVPREVFGVVLCPAGLLDDDAGLRPMRHIFVGVKAPWFDILDDLPRFETKP